MPCTCGVVADGLQNHQITEPGPTHPPAETKVHLPPHRLSCALLVRFPPNTQRGRRRKSRRLRSAATTKGSRISAAIFGKTVVFERHHHGNGERDRAGISLGRATCLGCPPGGCSRVGPRCSLSSALLGQRRDLARLPAEILLAGSQPDNVFLVTEARVSPSLLFRIFSQKVWI